MVTVVVVVATVVVVIVFCLRDRRVRLVRSVVLCCCFFRRQRGAGVNVLVGTANNFCRFFLASAPVEYISFYLLWLKLERQEKGLVVSVSLFYCRTTPSCLLVEG